MSAPTPGTAARVNAISMLRHPVQVEAPVSAAMKIVTEQGVPVEFDPGDSDLLDLASSPAPATLDIFRLSLRARELAAQPGFDRLICLPMVRDMQVLDHQVRAARVALRSMRGRAMLCDEVGLGKTVEAGLILLELMLRGLVRNVLVLTPPSLVEQWRGELQRKFAIDTVSHDSAEFRAEGVQAWDRFDRIVASFHTAKRSPHQDAILRRSWDMVIVDEAHHLRNRQTQLWRFASQIDKRFTLLLTATPVQNQLEELFNLVTLLEPGLLSTAKRFQSRFVDRRDRLTPRNIDELQQLLAEVMVRNRRSTVGLQFTRRWAQTLAVELAPAERQLYDQAAQLVRQQLAARAADEDGALSRMAMITLQMELGSSAAAAAGTLAKLAQNDRLDPAIRRLLQTLADTAWGIESSAKADRLLELLAENDDKLVVFTQFRATQQMLAQRLEDAGHEVALFHGGLGRLEKEQQIERFRRHARVLLATDSGSEGRNLQFCHAVCNFDLPWNPMRIEQRIGRLSRIGQQHDVQVFNLVATGTLEAAVLHLLEAKLAMFELVIGEIDMVLGNLDQDKEFADVIAELWAASTGVQDFAQRLDQLGERLIAAKREYIAQRELDDRIFGDHLRPQG